MDPLATILMLSGTEREARGLVHTRRKLFGSQIPGGDYENLSQLAPSWKDF